MVSIPRRFAPITSFEQGLLPFEESPSSGGSVAQPGLNRVEDIVHPAEVTIGPIGVVDAIAVDQESDRVIGLLAGSFGDR